MLVEVVPGALLDSIVNRSASRGSTGTTSGSDGQYLSVEVVVAAV